MSDPAYLRTYESGELARRVDEALHALETCRVCPRNCGVNRLKNETKLCRIGRRAKVASYFPHFGEEDCLRGYNGSGTIFFSWCNLKCVFCQNWDVSNEGEGREVSPRQLAHMMLELQERGCHNINFVTPEHVVPQLLEALPFAIGGGLRLPIVYNTSAYDSLHSLRLLDGIVDIYMPDFKYATKRKSSHYLKAHDYPQRAMAAISEMHRQVGDLVIGEDGLARRGLLVRHLVMPDGLGDSATIFEWLARLSPDTYVNIMDQYYPAGRVLRRPESYAELNRGVRSDELQAVRRAARSAGLRRFDERRPSRKLLQRFRFTLPVF